MRLGAENGSVATPHYYELQVRLRTYSRLVWHDAQRLPPRLLFVFVTVLRK
jgi:hypothetical protein